MASTAKFDGFPKQTVKFFKDLAHNNAKPWFAEHRAEYDEHVLAPAQQFIVAMGEKLLTIAPTVQAIPKIDKSIFRLYRDTRFSPDKSPFKTHLGIYFWEGSRPKMECSGFYFHLEPPIMMIGVGLYMFPKTLMAEYRDSVVHPVHGAALADAVRHIEKKGYNLGGQQYKKTPRGYDQEHPNAELLLYGGLWAGFETQIPPELHTGKLVDYCFKHYKALLPLHQWLVAMTERIS